MIEPLVRYIQEAEQTEDFKESLINQSDDPGPKARSPEEGNWREAGF